MDQADVDSSVSGSGVWERSDNSRWMVVAEGRHRIPRSSRASEGSVDPGLSIQNYITNFEVELPRIGENSSVVSDGSSLVRFDNPVEASASSEAGPSGEVSGGQQEEEKRSRKYKRQRRKRSKLSQAARLTCQSVESSPGRDCPSPDSLLQIISKHDRNDLL